MKIVDIAREAGVSIGTVDRVLHNRGRVSKETTRRIQEIIKAGGYRPNQMARNLKIGRELKIGVLIPRLGSEYGYWQSIKAGMDEAWEELSGFPFSIAYREFDRAAENDLFEKGMALVQEKADVIAMPPILASQAKAFIGAMDLPYVFFDSPLDAAVPLFQVLQNPYKAGFCAGRLMSLLAGPRGRFLTVQVYEDAYNLSRRAAGFRDYFKDSASEVEDLVCRASDDRSFEALARKVAGARCDGLFVTNDIVGRLTERLAAVEGYRMPVVIGFDAVERNVSELRRGRIAALISQQPRMQGIYTIRCVFGRMMLDNRQLDSEHLIPIEIFLKENIDP